MKKRFFALLCALGLLLALTLPAANGSTPTVYMLAVNDKLCDLPGGNLPVSVNGVIYIPYTAFDKSATGTDLGVYYGIVLSAEPTITLYSSSRRLIFAVNMGPCEDGDGNAMSFRSIVRNGIPYLPAAAVCGYFGLSYSFLPTSNRGTLIRISNASVTMTDNQFLNSASQAMTSRYLSILQTLDPSITLPPSLPPAPPTPTPTGNKEGVRVYLAVDASQTAEDLVSLFPSGVQALLLFTPDSLPAQSALVRRAVAAGHTVGLKVEGSLDEIRGQLDRGNELLSHIARTRTRVVSAPAELADALTTEGWACWQADLTGDSASALIAGVSLRRSAARVELPDRAAVITPFLSQLRSEGYDLRQPLETDL